MRLLCASVLRRYLGGFVSLSLAGGAIAAPPRISSIEPRSATGHTWIVAADGGLGEVRIGFDEPVSVPTGAIEVRSLRTGGSIPHQLSGSPDGRAAIVSFATNVQADTIEFVIESSIVNASGQRLDGELRLPDNPLLPTGDGFEGGDLTPLLSPQFTQ